MPETGSFPVWVLSDDRPGNRHQALGVAQRLSADVTVKTLSFNWKVHLPNGLLGPTMNTLSEQSAATLTAPLPKVMISVGRRAAPVAAYLKQEHPEVIAVHLMRPELPLERFDLVVVPDHDKGLEGPNLLRITGSPNHLTPARLTESAEALRPQLGNLKPPYIGLVVGGKNKAGELTAAHAATIGNAVSKVAEALGGSLLVTTSRRTGYRQGEALVNALKAPHYTFLWGNSGPNPYPGMLTLCDALIVTGDSTAMLSECCSVGKPVYVVDRIGSVGVKQKRLLKSLYEADHARPISQIDVPFHSMTPLDETGRVVSAIRAILEKH